MKYKGYQHLTITEDFGIFEFISVGKRGRVHKRIAFTSTEMPNVYSLVLLDENQNTGEVSDTSISDNGDRNKILATVAWAVDKYTRKFPHRWVYFKGNNAQRTRLYRMAIGINFEELSLTYHVYAEVGGRIVPFSKNMHLDGFLIARKKL